MLNFRLIPLPKKQKYKKASHESFTDHYQTLNFMVAQKTMHKDLIQLLTCNFMKKSFLSSS